MALERRKFLSGGLLAGVVSALGVKVAAPEPIPENKLMYRCFEIQWTDWKQMTNMSCFTAQWLARGPRIVRNNDPFGSVLIKEWIEDVWIYSSTPGDVRRYHPGQMFDVSVKEGQTLITFDSTQEQRDIEKSKALEALKKFIDRGEF